MKITIKLKVTIGKEVVFQEGSTIHWGDNPKESDVSVEPIHYSTPRETAGSRFEIHFDQNTQRGGIGVTR